MLQAWLDHRRPATPPRPAPRTPPMTDRRPFDLDASPTATASSGRRRRRRGLRRGLRRRPPRAGHDEPARRRHRRRPRPVPAGPRRAAVGRVSRPRILLASRWSRCSCSARWACGCSARSTPRVRRARPAPSWSPRAPTLVGRSATCSRTRASSRSAFVWDWYLRINGGGPFQAGEYQLADDSDDGRRRRHARAGPAAARGAPLHDARGLHRSRRRWPGSPIPTRASASTSPRCSSCSTAARCARVYQPADQPSNEGILFPETYSVEPEADELAGAAADGGRARRHDGGAGGGVRPGALQPHALRDPHRRLADRGGDQDPRGAGRRSRR